jgi:uncharacterized protein YegP (UPF0339 family)
MQFVIEQDNDNQFHWRLVGDDGADVVVSAASFASAKEARRAATDVDLHAGSATAWDADRVDHHQAVASSRAGLGQGAARPGHKSGSPSASA